MSRRPLKVKTVLFYAWPVLLFAGLFVGRSLDIPRGSAGAKLYNLHCASCHMEEGKGLQNLIPPLANSPYIQQYKAAEMACMIRYGIPDSMTKGLGPPMPGNEQLRPVEIATLISYLNTHWGNEGKPVTVRQVEEILQTCED